MNRRITFVAVMAWLAVAVYYFFQYALRSAPSVMMPQLTDSFSDNALGARPWKAIGSDWLSSEFSFVEVSWVHLTQEKHPHCHFFQRNFRGAGGRGSRH